tara:strand:- start:382 stop:522 length:141 start_codon:yes stop_codon:yes gene_type:complete
MASLRFDSHCGQCQSDAMHLLPPKGIEFLDNHIKVAQSSDSMKLEQ